MVQRVKIQLLANTAIVQLVLKEDTARQVH